MILGHGGSVIELLILFIVLAVIFGLFGFTRISTGFMAIARIIFFILLVLVLVWLVMVLLGVAII